MGGAPMGGMSGPGGMMPGMMPGMEGMSQMGGSIQNIMEGLANFV